MKRLTKDDMLKEILTESRYRSGAYHYKKLKANVIGLAYNRYLILGRSKAIKYLDECLLYNDFYTNKNKRKYRQTLIANKLEGNL